MSERARALSAAAACAGLAAAAFLTETLGGEAWRAALRWDRDAILSGEVWRLATAHLVHLNADHMRMNLLGMALVLATLWSVLDWREYLEAAAWSAGAISLGLFAVAPGSTYVGFSGVLHGLFAWGGAELLRRGPRWFGAVVVGCLAAKLGWEALRGPVPGAEAAVGGSILLASHALGALGGAVGWAAAWRTGRLS